MNARDFLKQEHDNVKQLLEQSLRYEYGFEGSQEFFEECGTRLSFISQWLGSPDELVADDLANIGYQLNELSKLICRIERSSLGEYSWPFVEELKKLATGICTEDGLEGQYPPKIYVLAGGGLDAYRIYPEMRRPMASRRRLLTIVFPKTLKHFVLLHPILGHEIGHALWGCTKQQAHLVGKVLSVLKRLGGKFESEDVTAVHLFDSQAPHDAQAALAALANLRVDEANFFGQWARWEFWLDEILCDLVGLATFGPSFAAAQCGLLSTLDPAGVTTGRMHPPVGWRINLVLRAAELLNLSEPPPDPHPLRQSFLAFWDELQRFRRPEPWFNVFDDNQIVDALDGIFQLLNQYPPSGYPKTDFDALGELVQQLANGVPPIGFHMSEGGAPVCSRVDFRHIVYAGWISRHSLQPHSFDITNRLCEHAIMQQIAIDTAMSQP